MPFRLTAVALVATGLMAGAAAGAGADRSSLLPPVCFGSCYAAPAGSGALLVFTGHGWGHGVGMSQFGAFGYAQHGATYQQILAHYYPGTSLGGAPTATIRVLLADRRKTLTISSSVPFTVTDAGGVSHAIAGPSVAFGPGLRLAVDGHAATTRLTPPLTFARAAGATLTLGRAYRGRLVVDVVDGKLRAIDVVPLEQYLYSVVPAEMPSNWAPAALEAQAVAARSYALATRQLAAPFDVYADTRSQLYLGVAQEKPSTTAAVDATRGQVVLYGSAVAKTYFYSTSGGQTESSQDWIGTAIPYLVSVPDPYDGISPYHDWGPVPVTARAAAKALKIKGSILDLTTTPDEAGRVGTVDVSTPDLDVALAGAAAQSALGLRSTWFSVGLLSLTSPASAAPVPFGSTVTVTGSIRGVGDVSLEQRTSGGSWHAVGPVTAGSDGTVTFAETPPITADYRLATPTEAAAYVRIRVTPAVTLTSVGATLLAGTEQPALPGAPVRVQQQGADGRWTTVATGTVGATGAFAVTTALTAGAVVRAVVAPGHGYWPGATAAQSVAG